MLRQFAHHPQGRRTVFAAAAAFTLLAAIAPAAWAERQSSINLFPHDTLLFVRTGNFKEFSERLKDTSTGRILADPQIKPILDQVVGEVGQLYSQEAETEVGVSWDELLKLPQGELAFGIVARPNATPALLLVADQGGEPSVARTLLDRALKLLKDQGGETTTETIDGVEITVVRQGGNQNRVIGVFERDGTIVAATDADVLRNVLWHWDGTRQSPAGEAASAAGSSTTNQETQFTPTPTLETNEKFIAILRECRRPNDPPPNLVLYADPIEIARQFGRASPGVLIALGLLPQLGLDGVRAVGGAMTAATGEYDSLNHFHVLLENPRAGVLSMIAFDTGDNTPQPWVPVESASYITGRWKFKAFYARLATIVDQFRGQGSFDQLVGGPVSERLGVDFKADIVDNLAGRITLVTGYDRPVTFQSRKQVFAIELVDEEAGGKTLETILARFPGMTEKRYAGPVAYYAFIIPGLDEMPEEQRPLNPFVAVMDKHLFLGSSTKLFEQMVAARQGQSERLADSKDFERFSGTLSKETIGVRPALLMMTRPELDWQFWYDLITSDQTRATIDQAASGNETLERFAKILRQGGLPPFHVLKKHLAPGGGILYDTDNGFHGIMFSLRGEE